MTLPAMCLFHERLYDSKSGRLKRRVHHPGNGRKALEREAVNVARQCPSCIAQKAA